MKVSYLLAITTKTTLPFEIFISFALLQMSNRGAPYEQIAESGDLTSTFSFSDKSIRHGSTEISLLPFIQCAF